MKKMKRIIPLLIASFFLVLSSCSEKDTKAKISVTDESGRECTEFSVPAEGGEYVFNVDTPIRWVVTTEQNWLMSFPGSGNGSGSFKLQVAENLTTESREGALSIMNTDGNYVKITVLQEGVPPLQVPETMDLKIMSFNILEGVKSGEAVGYEWRTTGRKERVITMLNAEKPDILSLQECRRAQLQDLQGAFPGYTFYSYAKDGVLADGSSSDLTAGIKGDAANDASFKNGGQRNVIAFRKDLFTVEDWGVFWHSETPYVASTGFGTTGQKITLWVKLKITAYDKSFYVACAHYIPQTYGNSANPVVEVITPCGVVNVAEMKKVIGDTVPEGTKSGSKEILFFMGDLNANDEAETMAPMNAWLENARAKAPVTNKDATYASGTRLDHIYYINATPTEFSALSATMKPDDTTNTTYGLLSDHRPVYCKFTIKLK